jgi:hypothetical protein
VHRATVFTVLQQPQQHAEGWHPSTTTASTTATADKAEDEILDLITSAGLLQTKCNIELVNTLQYTAAAFKCRSGNMHRTTVKKLLPSTVQGNALQTDVPQPLRNEISP